MTPGFAGKILKVDLSQEEYETLNPGDDVRREYIGGSGLAARYLYDLTGPDTDPLGPENVLIFMTGPFVGTGIPTSGRHAVTTKSPLTGVFAESDIGGTWGTALKRAGWDGVIITGRAEHPVYLVITDSRVELLDATHLWGTDTYAIEELLRAETNPRAAVTAIGQAGENLVRYASIMSDGKDGRAAGRTGVGAVMGSKNLKAIVTWGNSRVGVAKPEELHTAIREAVPSIVEGTVKRNKYGTAAWVGVANEIGDLPVNNWRGGDWSEDADQISGEHMADTILTGKYHCASCPIACGRQVKTVGPGGEKVEGGGPEYETLGMLGSMLLIDDLSAIAYMNQLCNQYGMDVISTGGSLAFAFECYERGLLTRDDIGWSLEWGDPDGAIKLIKAIAEQRGIGKLLAEGVRAAADEVGDEAREFAVHVKGLELPAHDPRSLFSSALAYATANRGACHLQALSYPVEISLRMPDLGFPETLDRFSTYRKGELVARMQDLMSLLDSLKVCKFIVCGGGGVEPHTLVKWLNLVTGWDMSLVEFLEAGERLYNLKRQYNVREGIDTGDDTLPKRMLTEPRPDGGGAGKLPPLDEMLHDYYEVRGWDESGKPSSTKLAQLGID